MRISDWSSDVCSSDLCSRTFGHGRSNSIRFAQNPGCASLARATGYGLRAGGVQRSTVRTGHHRDGRGAGDGATPRTRPMERVSGLRQTRVLCVHLTSSSSNREGVSPTRPDCPSRSEEHTSELQSLMRISYAVFCLKKKQRIDSYHLHTHYIIQ